MEGPEPIPDLSIGAGVRATGTLAAPAPWQRQALRRQGIAMLLRANRVVPTGVRRSGLAGRLDAIRERAETALVTGMPAREAALAQGFVLGQDDRLDAETVEQFRRSGLSHLLAVSGQNVVLLTLLAAPVLAAFGLSITGRLVALLALIAVYVPLAGAGASIQRAGVMGAAGVIATMAGRPGSRAFALLAAAAVTLAINPRASGDVGWQLSFAAVAGIFALAGPIRGAVLARLGDGRWSRAAGEGIAVTVAATVATAPLIAHHFEALPVGTLVANLLAMPAVAPAMWLGMIAAAAGQVPGLPLEPVNWLNALLLAYIAQVAAWLGDPAWAVLEVRLPGTVEVAAVYAGLAVAVAILLRIGAGRRLRLHRSGRRPGWVLAAAAAAGGAGPRHPGAGSSSARTGRLRAGRRRARRRAGRRDPSAPVRRRSGARRRRAAGRGAGGGAWRGRCHEARGGRRHPRSIRPYGGSAGDTRRTAGRSPRLRVRRPAPSSAARFAGATPRRVWQGATAAIRQPAAAGPLAAAGIGSAPPDPDEANPRSLVLLARWRGFRMLLCADAEAEAMPLDPGPIDVLKVAHHGSEDAGLGELLERSRPRLAVISVGDSNPFGHPTATTLATLEGHGVPVLRTDLHGSVSLRAERDELRVQAGG